MSNQESSKKCKDHYNAGKEIGNENLIRSLSEQYLLNNIENQKPVVQKISKSCEVYGYSDSQGIYTQNDFGTNFLFFVLIGICRLYIHDTPIADIKAGESFGEFPILQPGLQYTVTAKAKGECCIARLPEKDLRDIADKHPRIWENMSRLLVSRLNEANKYRLVKKSREKSRIFIGSSTEGLEVASKIQLILSQNFEPIIWNQGPFHILGKTYLECLEDVVNQYDYGIFIFTPDDKIEYRGESKNIARDNVIFELGMFVGKLTRKKTYLIHPKGLNLKILSDFDGITKGLYDPNTSNLTAALGPVCDKIKESIIKENLAQ